MSETLESQLRRYGRYHDSAQDPVDVAEVLEGDTENGAIRVFGVDPGRVSQRGPRRRPAWVMVAAAFAGALAVGLVVWLLLPSGPRSIAPATTTGTTRAPTTTVPFPPAPTNSVVDMTSLGEGGFAAVATDPDRVIWSPHGIDWYDIDPQHSVAPYRPVGDFPIPHEQAIGGVDGWVVVLDRAETGVWSGSLDTGEWNLIRFDTRNLDGRTDLLTLSTNDTDALVVSRTTTELYVEGDHQERHRYTAWVLNPEAGTAEEHTLPIPEDAQYGWAIAAWYVDRWVLAVTGGSDGALLSSPDGESWTESTWPFGEPPDYWGSLVSMSVGPDGFIALVCYWGGDSFWYSADGIEWTQTVMEMRGHESAYVENLGFVAGIGDIAAVSVDGRSWLSPSETGVVFERIDSTTEAVGEVFVFSDEMWTWSPEE
jgi:hypothetical protein